MGKKNKEKIISTLQEKLDITGEDANNIYNTSLDIINTNLKEKIKHPFKDLD